MMLTGGAQSLVDTLVGCDRSLTNPAVGARDDDDLAVRIHVYGLSKTDETRTSLLFMISWMPMFKSWSNVINTLPSKGFRALIDHDGLDLQYLYVCEVDPDRRTCKVAQIRSQSGSMSSTRYPFVWLTHPAPLRSLLARNPQRRIGLELQFGRRVGNAKPTHPGTDPFSRVRHPCSSAGTVLVRSPDR